MKSWSFGILVVLAVLTVASVLSCGQKEEPPKAESQVSLPAVEIDLPVVQKQVLDTLRVLWQQEKNLTTLLQAAAMLDVELTDTMRIEMMTYMERNLDLSPKLQRFQPYTFVLSNQEKDVGLYLVNYQLGREEFPLVEDIMSHLKLDEETVTGILHFLNRVGFLYDLEGPTDYNKLGYSFGSDRFKFVRDMGLLYHTLIVDSGKPKNVTGAKDVLLLIVEQYESNEVRYETKDPYVLRSITVIFQNGEVASVEPPQAHILEGGTTGTNNLYTSERNARSWARKIPFLRSPKITPVKVRLDELRELLKGE